MVDHPPAQPRHCPAVCDPGADELCRLPLPADTGRRAQQPVAVHVVGGYGQFIGLQAYVRMLGDPIFWKSLQVTAAYVVMKVPAQIALSMGLALFLARENRFAAIVRSAIFAPVVSSIVVVSVIWALMYHVQLGLINSIINSAGLPRIAF